MSKKKSKNNRRAKTTSRPASRTGPSLKKKQKPPTISLCMIVKNEEELLSQCLESVKDFVDEMIIVDTGSTDKTIEIAQNFGAKVYHHPWENDFSKHRNQSLSYATGDWILQLDADEELFAGSGQVLRDTVRKNNADFYFCQFSDIDRHGYVKGVFNLIRLFRNGMGMIFTQKVHNQLQVRGKSGYSKIKVKHYGYDLSVQKMAQKHIRTTSLLKKALVENPEDAYCRHQLAASYSMNSEYTRAIEHGEMALDLMRRDNLKNEFFITTFYLVAQAYYSLGQFEAAERISLEALTFFENHLDVCHILAGIYFKQQAIVKCRSISLSYLDIYKQLDDRPELIGSGSCYSYNASKRSDIFLGLGCTYFIEQEYQTADTYFRKAFEDSGRNMEKAENIYCFYLEQNMDEMALEWLITAYEAGCSQEKVPGVIEKLPGLYLTIAKNYLERADMDAADRCLELADDIRLNLGEKVEKFLLQIRIYWAEGAIENLVKKLESLLTLIGIPVNRCLNSFDDLGNLFYEVAEIFAKKQQWHLAEPTLNLATQIAPDQFKPEKFQKFLSKEEL